jgi:hypothetical protein
MQNVAPSNSNQIRFLQLIQTRPRSDVRPVGKFLIRSFGGGEGLATVQREAAAAATAP